MNQSPTPPMSPLRTRLHEIIFEAEDPVGKAFDVALLILIILSVLVVALETVQEINQHLGRLFTILEWVFTVLFTLEYLLRIYTVSRPRAYVTSFYGIVDLLAILPTYLSLIFAGSHYLITIRALRLLRVFRILKLTNFLVESSVLMQALRASRTKIIVFLATVLTVVLIVGTTMYLIEANAGSGFSSIPRSIYWAIVTVTTVGYGDIAPATPLGQLLSAILMILGYGVLAVPTGIVSVELAQAQEKVKKQRHTEVCPHCGREGHDQDATFCKYCGGQL
ncbi:MAG: ion transporter [Bacteroidetes bacterium]|nr:MAG: ion transporter [Bacteroidota bacterium]